MANPFLTLGGLAVGVIAAGFGMLQVPGWVASAQDASAKNDISQVSILQAASLSQEGVAQGDLANLTNAQGGPITDLGVDVSTQTTVDVAVTADRKSYAVVSESASGKAFLRIDGGAITEHANLAAAKAAATGFTFTP